MHDVRIGRKRKKWSGSEPRLDPPADNLTADQSHRWRRRHLVRLDSPIGRGCVRIRPETNHTFGIVTGIHYPAERQLLLITQTGRLLRAFFCRHQSRQ